MTEKVKKHRDYQNKLPSVTTILGVLRKIGLEYWFKANTAKFCNEESAKGKKCGTQIHDCIEQYILTGEAKIDSEYADEVMNALNSFILFRKENPSIKLVLSEVALTSEKYGFNGTIDAPNPPLLIDWKSGNAKDKDEPVIYDEAKYQVAAYVNLWNERNPECPIENAMIVCFAKDKVAYSKYEMDKEEIYGCFNEVFLSCLKIYQYQKGAN